MTAAGVRRFRRHVSSFFAIFTKTRHTSRYFLLFLPSWSEKGPSTRQQKNKQKWWTIALGFAKVGSNTRGFEHFEQKNLYCLPKMTFGAPRWPQGPPPLGGSGLIFWPREKNTHFGVPLGTLWGPNMVPNGTLWGLEMIQNRKRNGPQRGSKLRL